MDRRLTVTFGSNAVGESVNGPSFELNSCATHAMVVTTDADEHLFQVIMDGYFILGRTLLNEGPIHIHSANSHSPGTQPRAPGDRRHGDRTPADAL
jgi:hypothetical protein